MIYPTVAELMEAYRARRRHVLVKGYMASEQQKTFARVLAETRCPRIGDVERAELLKMVDEMNQEWIRRVIDTLKEHPRKHRETCWKCDQNEEALAEKE